MKVCLADLHNNKKDLTNQQQATASLAGCFLSPSNMNFNLHQTIITHTLSSVCGVAFIINIFTSRIIEKTCTGMISFNFFLEFLYVHAITTTAFFSILNQMKKNLVQSV